MYKLKLNAIECISYGICMDVCLPNAIDMRVNKGSTIEGTELVYLTLNTETNTELLLAKMMTFPFMRKGERCNGCMDCVNECPTYAIDINRDSIGIYSILKELKIHNRQRLLKDVKNPNDCKKSKTREI